MEEVEEVSEYVSFITTVAPIFSLFILFAVIGCILWIIITIIKNQRTIIGNQKKHLTNDKQGEQQHKVLTLSSLKTSGKGGLGVERWWKWFFVSFYLLTSLSIFQIKYLAWLSQERLDPIFLVGWIVLFVAVYGLLIYKQQRDKRMVTMEEENQRLREAAEYFRIKSEGE
ncbi:hypothetical protein [Halobacillus sp. BBL2006]|uniref:hypothetical protein n=1 Tax=Halobacillus sp. BBL2006 TaxID=1543706 RepID=UPI000542607C|nr:hypothetical protein [Halobacillus sp. BBL2006]KHE72467.1 hypothetical protein LD39_04375 [Halobacillus sp. BBL2006]